MADRRRSPCLRVAAPDRGWSPPLRDGARISRGGRHRGERVADGRSRVDARRGTDDLPGLVLYRDGEYLLVEGDGRLDVDRVDAYAPQGVTYTPHARDAVAAVDRGDAAAAFLLRPPRIEDV